jgi:hypothetical protein
LARTFFEFYSFYLTEHAHPVNRRLHFVGSTGALAALAGALLTWNAWLIVAGFVFGYGCAWLGHFRYERNKPATFKHPLYSFMADWVMFRDILIGRVSIRR